MIAAERSPRPRDLAAALALGLALLACAVFGVHGAIDRGWLGGSAFDDPVETEFAAVVEEAPQLADLETLAPDLHRTLVGVVRRDLDLGLGSDRIRADVLETFADWRATALPDAPDRVILAYLAVATERLRELERTNPALCAAMTLGEPAEDAAPYLSEQHRQREMNADRMLLRSGTGAGQSTSRMTRAEAQWIAREIEARLQRAFGASTALLDGGQPAPGADTLLVCRMGIATMDAVAALGPGRAAAAARSLFFAR
jgi:hypothetical protein